MHPYLARAQVHGTPLIEDGSVIFLWRGKRAPLLWGDFSLSADMLHLEQIDYDLWGFTIQLPKDGYFEYFFEDSESKTRLPDPYNARRRSNGLGQINHYFYMPDAVQTSLTRIAPGVSRGQLTQFQLATQGQLAGETRRVDLYQPPVEEPAPLLVIYDGVDYLYRTRLATMLDNLITQGRIQPLAAAFLANGGSARTLEYSCNESTLRFVLDHLLPLAYDQLHLIDLDLQPGAFGIVGASLGGLMALFSGLRQPAVFGRVLSQSGAFAIPGYEFGVYDLVNAGISRDLLLWMDVGRYENLLEANRRMNALLVEEKYQVNYREYNAGHNYTAWRNDVWRGLEHLFPPSR